MISTNEFKNGMHISLDGIVYRIVEFQHVKPGKGGAFVRTKLKALSSGGVVDKTFRAGEKMPRVRTEVTNVSYLYNDGSDVVLMDSETFEQINLPIDTLEDELRFMRENDIRPAAAGRRQADRRAAAGLGRARGDRYRARREGRHRVQRDQAGDARDGRGRAGAAVREHRREDQGRYARGAVHLAGVTRLVDTTVRLLSQQPLAGTISTASVLDVAEILDAAGFEALEVTGGGCFDTAVKRGTESPWERVRALKARCRQTPLQMALRGRFLVGSRPVSDDLTRRFILCAAESGIDIFRLHDPLNDVENLTAAAAAVREAGGRLYAGLAFSGQMANLDRVLDKAKRLAELGADHVLLHDPAGALDPGTCGRVVARLAEDSGVPVGLYCQGESALAMAIEAARDGATPVAVAAYPVASSLNRVPGEVLCEALAGLGIEHGLDTDRLWDASEFIDEHVNSQMPSAPISPRITLRAARNRLPVGLVADLDTRLRRANAVDRLDEVLDELKVVREDCGRPPLAQPIGGILAGQALRHVLSARRWADTSEEMRRYLSGSYGTPPLEISDGARRHAGARDPFPDVDMDELRESVGAASEEDLLLLALFGEDAERLLLTLRGRGERDSDREGTLEPAQSERIRELIRMVEESDVGELTLEDGPVRITVRKQDDQLPAAAAPVQPSPAPAPAETAVSEAFKIESPMVGTFYRSPSPEQPVFVSEGDSVAVGQTICILEAMKLFNELKSDHAGVIRRILVENGEPVEFGQPLFELEPA